MSDVIDQYVAQIKEKVGTDPIKASVKIVIHDEGSFIIDPNGVVASDGDAKCTMTMSDETFRGMLDGSVNGMTAMMSGKLKVKGAITEAIKLRTILFG